MQQQMLFEALPSVSQKRTAVNARTIKKRIVELENIITAADATFENSRDYTAVCREHLRRHREGRVDDNWIDGALRLGLFDIEDAFPLVRGRYSRSQVQTLKRHIRELGMEAISWREPRAAAVAELAHLRELMGVAA